MATHRIKLYIATVLVCLKCCEALFYTNSKENDYPRIGKRPSYLDKLNKFGFSKIQSDYFTHKRGESEEYVHSLREALMPDSEETFEIIDDFTSDAEPTKQERFVDAMRSYLRMLKSRNFYDTIN